MAVTIKDIANAAGVSIATASLILNKKEGAIRFSQNTQEKVRQAALSLGYIPNMAARNLRQTDRTNLTIAVVWPIDRRVKFIGRVLTGIQNYISDEKSVNINLIVKTFGSEGLKSVKELLAPNLFNGAILSNMTVEDEEYLHSITPKVPIVLFHRSSPQYPYVNADNFAAAQSVAKYFTNSGHKKIAVLAPVEQIQSWNQRIAGFYSILAGNYAVYPCASNEEGGYEAVARLVREGYIPTGLICICDQVAMGALAALQTAGIAVPDECEVFGFDNQVFSNFTIPKLSTVNLPVEEMAYYATMLLVERCTHIPASVGSRTFEMQLLHRDSTKNIFS
jgi:LacI family transcriptional regulator